MTKKSICILLLLGAVAAVVVAALYQQNSNSLLMQYINSRLQPDTEDVNTVDSTTYSVDTVGILPNNL